LLSFHFSRREKTEPQSFFAPKPHYSTGYISTYPHPYCFADEYKGGHRKPVLKEDIYTGEFKFKRLGFTWYSLNEIRFVILYYIMKYSSLQ